MNSKMRGEDGRYYAFDVEVHAAAYGVPWQAVSYAITRKQEGMA